MENCLYEASQISTSTYIKNKPLFDFIISGEITEESIKQISEILPSENKFLQCLNYLCILHNDGTTDFDNWLKICDKTLNIVSKACTRIFTDQKERNLILYAFAFNSFPFEETGIEFVGSVDREQILEFSTVTLNSPERIWAGYIVSNMILNYCAMIRDNDIHLFISMMKMANATKSEYENLKRTLPYIYKKDTEK